ncbi:hypothetical protein BJY04DRAFT_19104 [Aspergillus karnatakaensis]|uniref:uncharacterized protein n=1 Tax=Aspergillus karnatakaensis TaxID=1810916 RepID=UPI003CCDD102
MPVPTPAPFPAYKCWYDTSKKKLEPMSSIPSIRNDRTLYEHYRRRNSTWFTSPLVTCMVISHMYQVPPVVFLNERHYEVVRTIASYREMDQLRTLIQRRDRHQIYSLRFDPLLVVHDDWEARVDYGEGISGNLEVRPNDWEEIPCGLHYCLVDMRLQCAKDTFDMRGLEMLPVLGTPVEIRITNPCSSHKLSRSNGDGADLEDDTCTFPGVVVKAPKQYDEVARDMSSPVCILVSCGQCPMADFQELLGTVMVRPSTLLHDQARSALQSVLYGNATFGINPGNVRKKLLLAHDTQFRAYLSHPWGRVASESVGFMNLLRPG